MGLYTGRRKAAAMVHFPLPACYGRAALVAALMLVSQSAFADDPIEAKAKVCAACHGEAGIPTQKNIPVIWGQNAGYLIYQLRDFKSGARKNDIMSPIAATIDPADVSALAIYFSKLKWPNLQQPPAAADVATKAQATAASVGCPGCHLAYFQGDGTTARLAGQNHDYLLKTMNDFRDKTRGNNPGMSDLMKAISPDDISALADYLAGLQIDAYLNQGQ
jgi:cytochrome c553